MQQEQQPSKIINDIILLHQENYQQKIKIQMSVLLKKPLYENHI